LARAPKNCICLPISIGETQQAIAPSSPQAPRMSEIATEKIRPPHEVWSAEKMASIQDKLADGWGDMRPLLVLDRGENGLQALTGSHRWAAAMREGIAKVPCLVLKEADLGTGLPEALVAAAAAGDGSDGEDHEPLLAALKEIDAEASELFAQGFRRKAQAASRRVAAAPEGLTCEGCGSPDVKYVGPIGGGVIGACQACYEKTVQAAEQDPSLDVALWRIEDWPDGPPAYQSGGGGEGIESSRRQASGTCECLGCTACDGECPNPATESVKDIENANSEYPLSRASERICSACAQALKDYFDNREPSDRDIYGDRSVVA